MTPFCEPQHQLEAVLLEERTKFPITTTTISQDCCDTHHVPCVTHGIIISAYKADTIINIHSSRLCFINTIAYKLRDGRH